MWLTFPKKTRKITAAMPDIIDRANDTAAQHIAAALSAHKPAAGRGPVWRNGKAYCRECGGEVAEARVKALPEAEICIDCAREAEQWR